MKKILILVLIVIIFFLISGCEEKISSQRILESAKVLEVIDGDTIKLENNEVIRLLHINTAEKGEKCYEEAKEKLRELVENKTIWLERDMQDIDKYDRKLRYIFLNYNTNSKNYESFVNLIILEEGLASLLIIEPNMKYKPIFESAIENVEGCLFEKSSFFNCFSIKEFNYDPEGRDCEKPNEEYVIIKNTCQDIEMNEWAIKDAARHTFKFDDFILKQKASFTLHSGSGQNNQTDFYWNIGGSCSVVWNNDGDSLFLRDADEKLVLYYSY